MIKIVGVGPRETDFLFTNGFIDSTVTLYGSGGNNNTSYCINSKKRINHNVYSKDQDLFIESELEKWIDCNPNVRFMSYDPNQAYYNSMSIVERTVCLNEKSLMDKLNNKVSFRKWARNVCQIHSSKLLFGYECEYKNLKQLFGGYNSFVVQAIMATGGEGTNILTEKNESLIRTRISPNEQYLVSGYEEKNIPVNMHAIISDDDIKLFPISIQILIQHNGKLLYHGSDYIEAKNLKKSEIDQFYGYMINICEKLQKEGYRGITGVDAIIVNGKVHILEMNNRFQGSTLLLNLALQNAELPSMQELNYMAFYGGDLSFDSFNLDVPYSSFTYMANDRGEIPTGHIKNYRKEKYVETVFEEGLSYEYKIDPFATLERVVFKTNITSITEDGCIALHPSIPDFSEKWFTEITHNNLLYLKIALINMGVVIEDDAKAFLAENGGMREGVYYAVDITIDSIIINSPICVKFVSFSPFRIHVNDNQLQLFCCGKYLKNIEIPKADILSDRLLSSGTRIKDICLLATDRVRIQHSTNCCFKKNNIGCDFCEVENHDFDFNLEDVFEAVDCYIHSNYEFRHFLIGGRTDTPSREAISINAIAEHIQQQGEYPIYVMTVPPMSTDVLDDYYHNGVTEIALNIEIWDRSIAQKWMPGKGSIPLERYFKMLEYSVSLWGKKGSVRTSFIVGLEPVESLLEGVREVCKIGVAPILSVFRPIPFTKGENNVPLSNDELLSVYNKAQSICSEYNLYLGPECVPCQNNTLSMPYCIKNSW